MIIDILVAALLLFACFAMLYICLHLHYKPARRAPHNINQKSQTRAAAFTSETPFRGRFRDIAAREYSPKMSLDETDDGKRSLRAKHLAVLGYTHMPEPHLLTAAYKRLASKWHPDRYGTPTYSDLERARARAKFAALNRAYKWLIQN